MISLFLDTCNYRISLGLLENNKLISSKTFINDNNLSERLLPIIRDLFSENNVDIKDLNKIYIAVGPGSFTGIRIGVTVAKVIAWSLNIDIVPISSLEVMASTNTEYKYVCPIIDARRGYVYGSLYDNKLKCIIEDNYIELEKLLNNVHNYDKVLYVSYDELVDSIEPIIDIERVVKKHSKDKSINPHSINPIYLKKTEAEEKHDQRD